MNRSESGVLHEASKTDQERREEQAGKLLERAARTVAALDPGDLRAQAARLRLAATDAEHAAQRLRDLIDDLEAPDGQHCFHGGKK